MGAAGRAGTRRNACGNDPTFGSKRVAFPLSSQEFPKKGINLKQTVEDFEREIILEALEKTGWVKNKAATILGLNRTTLVEKLKKMKISRDD